MELPRRPGLRQGLTCVAMVAALTLAALRQDRVWRSFRRLRPSAFGGPETQAEAANGMAETGRVKGER